MTTKNTLHTAEIVRDDTWPLNEGIAAYTWQCDCGDTSPRFYGTDLYGDEIEGEVAEERARSATEIDSLDHTELSADDGLVSEAGRTDDEWELSL